MSRKNPGVNRMGSLRIKLSTVLFFVGFMIVLGTIYFVTQKITENFEPTSTCAKDPYRENNKLYWKQSDRAMCPPTDYCQVQKDNKGRIEFAICVTKPIFTGA
jgi:hypothetical protein